MIGQIVGDYLILEKRGEGGMGMFYKAQDQRLERLVGLKTLRAELLHDPEVLNRLQSEAKSLARLDHPNIARLLHYMVVENQHFIVMEFVAGLDLAEKTRQDGLLSFELLAEISRQVCAAVGYAHGKNVIHRDLKPSNILITPDNTVKVTDFGIAKILGEGAHTRTGSAVGSLPYMAPEQIRGAGVDARTDIYQLGVMLYELACGRRPFVADNEYDMMTAHLETAPPKPSSINTRVSPGLDSAILRALSKSPEDRFQSAREFDTVLQAELAPPAEAKTTFRAPSGPTPAKTPKWRIVVPIVALLLAVALALRLHIFSGGEAEFVESATVEVTAALPPTVDTGKIARVAFEASGANGYYRETPEIPFQVAGGTIRLSDVVYAGGSIRFALTGFDANGQILFRGAKDGRVTSGEQLSIELSLAPVAGLVADRPTVETTVTHAGETGHVVPAGPAGHSTIPPHPSGDGSSHVESSGPITLILDVVPFNLRDQVSKVWVDGRPIPVSLPESLSAAPGQRRIRWQVGKEVFTDTATVGADGIRNMALAAEFGHGRLNVAASFPDGGWGEIWIDGVNTGQGTPYEFREYAAGPHEIVIKREGYEMRGGWTIVNVEANGRTQVQVEMNRK